MPHPAAYVFTFAAAIGLAVGVAIYSYMSSRNETYGHHYKKNDDRYQYIDPGSTCTICLENIGNTRTYLSCGHVFHEKCIRTWRRVNDTCPNCKVRLNFV